MSNSALKGVNLGGWLLLEKWMTPDVFRDSSAEDEYTLSQSASGREAIKRHHASFIQESDFQWMQQHGVEAIRLPVGYWLFESDEHLTPHIQYVDWVMDMAKKYDIEVLIDLHGLKGSQNGRDHSGKSGQAEWFNVAQYREQTIETLVRIAERYAGHPKFWGLQLINEPFPKIFNRKLRLFYKAAASRLAPIIPGTRIIFSDSFTPRLMSGALSRAEAQNSVMDIHVYHPFRPWVPFVSLEVFFRWLARQKRLYTRLSKQQPLIIGEWSGVIRHEHLEKVPEQERRALEKEYIRMQEDVFDDTLATFYWTYKTQEHGIWNYRSLIEANIIENRKK